MGIAAIFIVDMIVSGIRSQCCIDTSESVVHCMTNGPIWRALWNRVLLVLLLLLLLLWLLLRELTIGVGGGLSMTNDREMLVVTSDIIPFRCSFKQWRK